MSEIISIREFARRLNITDRSVRKAIEQGKIHRGLTRNEKGQPAILAEVAAAEWIENHNPTYVQKPGMLESLQKQANQKPPAEGEGERQQDTPDGKRSIAELKRMALEVKIQREAIELRKAKAELVDKKAVYAALFAAGQEVKTALTVIPDRIIDTLLAAKDRNEAHLILTTAIHEALSSLADLPNRQIIK